MSKPQIYNMKWNNYQNHIGGIFLQLLQSETMVDLTLCAEGERISCHKIILSACSPYFQEILAGINSSHAIVILCGISAEDVRSIIEFVYKGELSVTAEKFSSIIKAAEDLKISGLMEVNNHLPVRNVDEHGQHDNESAVEQEVASAVHGILPAQGEMTEFNEPEPLATADLDEGVEIVSESIDDSPPTGFTVIADAENGDLSDIKLQIETMPRNENTKRRKREFTKKDYSEEQLSAAIDDLIQGRSLLETANRHHIPRSTLYARARNYGISPSIARQEYSEEKVLAAIEVVKAGASLQTASVMYGVPKTVLWRRVQRDIGCYALSRRARMRQRYLPHAKEAAIRALERGEKINVVSLQYKIPKTTLFREKSRLVEQGKLPASCLKRRTPNNDCFKQVRLRQAVEACKAGRMSQAAASSTFKVSKTTIWRRLQKYGGLNRIKYIEPKIEPEEQESNLDFQEVITEMPVAYGEDGKEYPFIILTPTGCGNNIAYQVTDNIISSMVPHNVEDVGEVIEIQETPSYSEDTPSYSEETPSYSEDVSDFTKDSSVYSGETPDYVEDASVYSEDTPAYSEETLEYSEDIENESTYCEQAEVFQTETSDYAEPQT